jgi:hypothetical protein
MLQAASSFESNQLSRSTVVECSSGRAFLFICVASSVLSAAACKFETKAIPATQIVVDVQADAVVRNRTERVQFDVWAADRLKALTDAEHVYSQTLPRFGKDLEDTVWPMRLVFAPRGGDAKRVFEFSVIARGGDGAVLARSKVITSFIEHEARYVQLQLAATCIEVKCRALETCRGGACVDAWRDPADLPHVPRKSPGMIDSLIDAAVDDASSRDATADAAESVDARPARSDAGVNRCQTNNGGCDPLVTCEWLDGAIACGACPHGFEDTNGDGTRCADLDECKTKNGGCDLEHGTCKNLVGSYECKCVMGYYGNGRECALNVPCSEDPSLCDTRATCMKMQQKRVCVCGAGFEGDGGQCRDVDECKLQPDRCGAHGKCVNTEGAFECLCDAGWTRSGDACVDVDECEAKTDNCTNRPNACVNTQGSFTCKCPKGFTGPAVGSEGCNDTDECHEHMANCSSNADCTNTRGSFTCACKGGFSGDGVTCKKDDDAD